MKLVTTTLSSMACTAALLLPMTALAAADQPALKSKIDSLSQQLEELKQQMKDLQQKESAKEERVIQVEKNAKEAQIAAKQAGTASRPAIEISGDFRTRFDSMRGTSPTHYSFSNVMPWMMGGMVGAPPQPNPELDYKNNALLTNRFALDLKARATEDVTVKARLLMYKIWGHHHTASPAIGSPPFFADKFFIFDGNMGHIPEDETLSVDQAYATWSGIGNMPLWFSIGRRPSTGGVPTHLRQNIEKDVADTAGVPGLVIDYAFDGATIGFAPDIPMLPGAYGKLCYGKGYDSGFATNNTLKDVNFFGINIVPYATDNLRVELQWDRAYDIFAFPETSTIAQFNNAPNTNLGDIDQFFLGISGKLENVGPGDLNLFLSSAVSKTHPNDNLFMGVAGLMYDAAALGGTKESKTGTAIYLGGRYDIKPIRTKFGLEYNHGSQNWVSFTPASDDMWTAKQGVHGNVYEAYIIHELAAKPIAKSGKAQFRLGYQYYDFKYTGSNNWVGAPKNIDDLANMMNAQMLTPLADARNIYLTFDVMF